MYHEFSQLDQLVAERHERHERHVLIRHCDEAAFDHRLVGAAPVAPGQLLVLVSPRAQEVPSLVDDLPVLLRSMPVFTPEIESVWLGVGSLAADTDVAQRLAEKLDVEIVAPDGGVAAMPGAALYAGHTAGGTGWYRFRPDRPAQFHGARFPLPEWESWLPATPVEAGDVVAVPAPCGLLVRDRLAGAAEFGDIAFGVPVDHRFPKLVVDGPAPSPADVAAVLGGLAARPIMVVPATPEAASHIWQVELALRLSRDVVFSAGPQVGSPTGAVSTVVPDAEGDLLFRPFPVVLRQPAGGGDQQVLDIAAAPPGWVRDGHRSYRLAEATGEVVADVVPSGLVLRAEGALADPAAEAAPFDPEGWTLTLGAPGQVTGPPVLAAAQSLLAALPPEQVAAVRVRMAGIQDEEAEHTLGHAALPPVPPVPVAEPSGPPEPDRPIGAGPMPVAVPPSLSAMPPIMTTSAAPVSTVSGPPALPPAGQPDRAEPDRLEPDLAEPERAEPERQPDRAEPERSVADSAADPGRDEPGELPEIHQQETPAEREATPERPPAAPDSGSLATPPPAGTPPMRLVEPAARPLVVPVRASTAAEQTRFTAAGGDSFGEALATVNAALATWPSMRADESPGAKADYVAVCLYLGRGEGGAHAINGALRTGHSGALDGQVPCLMSGIRRLPTHRRAVLRQGKVNESLERRSAPGTVLTEPGFLTASVDLDVTLPDADLDVLIWPNSARRTSELMLSRPVEEVVFVAGARFKALAVRTAKDDDQEEQEDDGGGGGGAPAAPKVAVLFRELAPGEAPDTTELDERDLAVLAKLDNVLARRQQGQLRLVEDSEAIARLTTSLVAWRDEATDAGRTTAVAS